MAPSPWVWHTDLLSAAVCGALAAGYLLLARRVPGWPVARTLCFLSGLVSVLVLRSSYLGVEDHTLFWVLAVDDVLLLMVVPQLLVAGRPLRLLRGGRPARHPAPAAGALVSAVVLLAVYLTPWDALRLRSTPVFDLTQLLLLLAGGLFVAGLLHDDRMSAGVRLIVALVDGLLDAVPGIAVLATHGLIAGSWYLAHPRSWGPSAAQDQQIGGGALIALSELVGLPLLLALLVTWVHRDAEEATVTDRVLDEALAEAPGGLWWEQPGGPLHERARRQGWS